MTGQTAWRARQIPYYPPGHDHRVSRDGGKRQSTSDPSLSYNPLETHPEFLSKEEAIKRAGDLNSSKPGVHFG
jgi:hypothetical protein